MLKITLIPTITDNGGILNWWATAYGGKVGPFMGKTKRQAVENLVKYTKRKELEKSLTETIEIDVNAPLV